MRANSFAVALLVGCLPLALPYPAEAQKQPPAERLMPGPEYSGRIVINDDPEATSFKSFVFDIDDDVLALAIELEAAADLDLYLDTSYVADYQDVLRSSAGYSGSEQIRLDFSREPELASTSYYIDVAYGRLEPPLTARGQPIREVPFTLKVTPFHRRIDGTLEPGRIVSDRIDPASGGPYRNFRIDVPRGTRALRVDLASDATDLDLRVRREQPMRSLADADAVAVSWAGNETILIDNGGASIPAGTWYIDVFDQAWLDWPADFRLTAAFTDQPPPGLIDLPVLAPGTGIDGAARATVEVLHADGGGTGVLLSPAGHILTNYHVVSQVIEAGPNSDALPLIGLTVEPAEGSRVRLLARIVAHEKALDMALLEVSSDIYGNPLPADYRFPTMAVGDPEQLRLGDPLFVLGYPEAGSLGTRASITLTRGIVSGFERRGPTLLIKTDADIAAGNSGGPVLNENHELIGLATETISEEFGNSQVGYIWPLWLVPAEWWAMVDAGRRTSDPDSAATRAR